MKRDRRPADPTPARPVQASRTQHAANEIAKAIVAGALRPGQQLAEQEWARRLSISRIPVREALRDLEREGLVEIRPRRGAFVARMDRSDFMETYEIRAVLEGFAARLCAFTIGSRPLQELEAVLEQMRSAAATGEADRYGQLSITFLQLVWDNVPNRLVRTLIRRLWRRCLRLRLITIRLDGYVQHSLAAHEHLFEALRDHDPKAAEMVRWLAVQRAKRALMAGYYAHPEQRSELERGLAALAEPALALVTDRGR